jgi:hypothetical protein
MRAGAWVLEVLDALPGDDCAGSEQGEGEKKRGELLGFAVAVGVIVISRFLGHFDADQSDNGSQNVVDGLDAVCDEGVGMPDQAGDDLDGGEGAIGEDANLDSAHSLAGGGWMGQAITDQGCEQASQDDGEARNGRVIPKIGGDLAKISLASSAR